MALDRPKCKTHGVLSGSPVAPFANNQRQADGPAHDAGSRQGKPLHFAPLSRSGRCPAALVIYGGRSPMEIIARRPDPLGRRLWRKVIYGGRSPMEIIARRPDPLADGSGERSSMAKGHLWRSSPGHLTPSPTALAKGHLWTEGHLWRSAPGSRERRRAATLPLFNDIYGQEVINGQRVVLAAALKPQPG
jgi:hypothetical protein